MIAPTTAMLHEGLELRQASGGLAIWRVVAAPGGQWSARNEGGDEVALVDLDAWALVLHRVQLGDFTAMAAGLDDAGPAGTALDRVQFKRHDVRNATWRLEGTRRQLLAVLYFIESAPAFWSGEGDKSEASALKRTSRAWRRILGMSASENIPAPAEACV